MSVTADSDKRLATRTRAVSAERVGGERGARPCARQGQPALRRGALPPAALGLARLVGECLGEHVWREALAEVQREAQEPPKKTE